MNEEDLEKIEGVIGYSFDNKDLLQQAFVRRSYSNEHGGQNNEVLEFIGDSILNTMVVKYIDYYYGKVLDNAKFKEYKNKYKEAYLTEIKKSFVERKNLAKRIDALGLNEYLILGSSDINKNVQDEPSVKEDLFEAIIGAVAVDSEWNFEELEEVVDCMLDIDNEIFEFYDETLNYVNEIQQFSQKRYNNLPFYIYEEVGSSNFVNANRSSFKPEKRTIADYDFPEKPEYTTEYDLWNNPFQSRVCHRIEIDGLTERDNYICFLKLDGIDDCFYGFGISKTMARFNACECAYKFLDYENLLFTIQDEIENPNINLAINQLEILARRGYFSIPTYEFEEKHDIDGNPIWTCYCYIEEIENPSISSNESSKKQAKKSAAYKMLNYVLKNF